MGYLSQLPDLDWAETAQQIGAICLEAQILDNQVSTGTLCESLDKGCLAAAGLSHLPSGSRERA